jgi:serine/threonine protein kinase
MSPETIQKRKVSKYNDVWSYGVTCWEIFTFASTPYFEYLDLKDVALHVVKGGRLLQPANCHANVWSLITSCWKTVPTERPSFALLIDEMLHAMNPLYRKKNPRQADVYFTPAKQQPQQDLNSPSSPKPQPGTQPSAEAQQALSQSQGGSSKVLPPLPVKKVTPPPPSVSLPTAVAMYDYEASTLEELSFAEGETVVILKQDDSGWWMAKNSKGRVGSVPSNYLKLE